MKNQTKPDISKIRVFGSVCYYKAKGNNLKKLDPKAYQGILVGFNENIFKIFNPETKKSIWVRDIHIIENQFLTEKTELRKIETPLHEIYFSNKIQSNQATNQINKEKIPQTQIKESISDNTTINHLENEDDIIEADKILYQKQPMMIQKSMQISPEYNNKDNDIDELALLTNINCEPNTYKEAITSPESKEWINAMQAEVNELQNQKTWSLSDLPPNKVPLKGRWIYKIKTDLNGNIIKYKARWVVKGFNQVLGVDYLDTFSTTCRPESYRIILILALHNKWQLNQYDVKNAFIHTEIDKEIYVEQPHG
ncbi:hypothetical protein K3495_g15903, partial [Podosphaera aphanis]